ncbi:MAG: hypothetical protein ACRD4Q_08365 [Candidatus Acidiferrales bacterium]
MKRLIGVVAATVVIFGSLCFSAPCAVARPAGAAGQVAVAAVDDPGVLAADRAFVQTLRL